MKQILASLILVAAVPLPVARGVAAVPASPSARTEHAEALAGTAAAAPVIEVLFDGALEMRLRDNRPQRAGRAAAEQLSASLASVLARAGRHAWQRGCEGVTEARLDELQARGQANHQGELYNLNNIFHVQLDPAADAAAIARELSALPGVRGAHVMPPPTPPPLPPNYVPNQQYLLAATNSVAGYDASYAWRWPGGNGAGVTICDIEYGWNFGHADLTKLTGSLINASSSLIYSDHGTAAAGILVSDSNSFGTVGIAHGAAIKTCGAYYGGPSWNIPGALALATAALSPGDVILLEQQWDSSPSYLGDYVPIEWWYDYTTQTLNGAYAAIQTAIANGIHVVEAGGNGDVNMDALTWYGDSGAIIVGAGGAYAGGSWTEGARQRLPYSTYGARFDVQGWGEDVYTTGYGDEYAAEGSNYWYTSYFSGTSSGSATIAGVVACLEGFWEQYYRTNCPPWLARRILKMTGEPQVLPPAGNIGPRPNLRAAFFADTDSDGMLDGWEWANRLSPTNAADAAQDADGDGVKNIDEFRADTNPQSASSRLAIQGLSISNNAVVIEFLSTTSRFYDVSGSTNPAALSWTSIVTNQAGSNAMRRIIVPLVAPGQVIRVGTARPAPP